MLVIDCFSKACCLIFLFRLPTALETAEHLCNYGFWFYGLPEDIVSYRGPQFASRVRSVFLQQLNVIVSLTSDYNPQSNGQTECMNQELTCFLISYWQQNQADWSRYLMWEEYAQNVLRKQVTGITPFKCIIGF